MSIKELLCEKAANDLKKKMAAFFVEKLLAMTFQFQKNRKRR